MPILGQMGKCHIIDVSGYIFIFVMELLLLVCSEVFPLWGIKCSF